MSLKKKIAKILNRWSWKLNPEYYPVAKIILEEKIFDVKILRVEKSLTDKTAMQYPAMEEQLKRQAIEELQKATLPFILVTENKGFRGLTATPVEHSTSYCFTLFVGKRIK